MNKIQQLSHAMIHYNNGDPKRIQHTTKVHAYASLIGTGEGLDEKTQFILESAALVHDIGIRASEKKYGHQNGKLQEQEGPAVVRDLLTSLGGYTEEQIDRICWLVAHHHTYHVCEDLDYQILIEADFLVNLYEDNESLESIQVVRKNIFRTESGLKMLDDMFGLLVPQQPSNPNAKAFDYLENVAFAATVCNKEGIVLYQNAVARMRDGDATGKNLYNCHTKKSGEKIRYMMETGQSNTYETIHHGKHYFIHHTPWFQEPEGELSGLIELDIEIPETHPTFNRDKA